MEQGGSAPPNPMSGTLSGVTAFALRALEPHLAPTREGFAALGAPEQAAPLVVALLAARHDGALLWLVSSPSRAHVVEEELTFFVDRPVLRLPESERLPFELAPEDPAAAERRERALLALRRDERVVVVASWPALAERLLPPASAEAELRLKVGDELPLPQLLTRLEALGYDPEPVASRPGSFARRAGIVDVFPAGGERPLRIEFLGNQIESIRAVDLASQRSTGRVEEATFPPSSYANEALRAGAEELLRRLGPAEGAEAERFCEELERVAAGGRSAFEPFFASLVGNATALDYFGPRTLLVVEDREAGEAALRQALEHVVRVRSERERRGQIPSGLPLPLADPEVLAAALEQRLPRVSISYFGTEELGARRLPLRPVRSFAGNLSETTRTIREWAQAGKRVVVASQQAVRLGELLEEAGVRPHLLRSLPDAPAEGAVALVAQVIGAGVEVAGQLVLLSDTEIFGFRKQRRLTRVRRGLSPELLSDLEVGAYLVHRDHGIARYGGLVRRVVGGVEREYLELQYAEGDRLYVPTDQLDAVSRYVGPSDHEPTLTRLHTGEWAHTKRRVRRAVATMARDLLELYAKRQLVQGFAFPPDTPWQLEMEAGFPFVETPDQLAAIADVKRDMESPRPMDRLICGDVGFGKTEVAIRAAFKAVMAGKQVAVLVPTTVLAEQHGRTFRERLAGFPVRVEVLSRFRSESEQREIIAATARGDVDILIGTHRILQKDVAFKDLGLLIVDEEQRFGVEQKEQLKRMRTEIDVLALSATPIPRTLQMSLSGIRDMSTIMTPPEDRQPVRTYVTGWDDEVVREAITRELQRGGQVYFVHNRVQSIGRLYRRLQQLVPEARIVVGHGQMPEGELERVMAEFAAGEHDVLLCTTIIENGLDIPNVNTIIVDQADRLGLAQLYQLRGRVGRADRQAYAYFLYDPAKPLSETAQRRLAAIFESQELGAGLQIALRDLEIRGAGNLLGTEQSGYIAAVGFELYSELLAEAVEALKRAYEGKPAPAPPPPPTRVDLPLSAFLPESYVEDPHQRLAIYQRLARAESVADVARLREELRDRFGPLPEPAEQLLLVTSLRLMGTKAGAESIVADDEFVHVRVRGGVRPEQAAAVRALGERALLVGPEQVRIDLGLAGRDWPTLLVRALRALIRAAAPAAAAAPA